MNTNRILLTLFALALVAGLLYWFFGEKPAALYETERVTLRDIAKTIFAAGTLEAKGQIKVGSLTTGIVQDLYVKESDAVEKGQLLAVIDTGIGETDVRKAEANYFAKDREAYFLKRQLNRQKKLFEKKYVSEAIVDEAEKLYQVAEETLKSLKATWDQAAMQYENTNIRSPSAGIVTAVGVAKGERVTTDLNATIICEIAPNVSQMEAILNVDERDIGLMKKGLEVHLTVDAFPEKRISSVINSVSFSPKKSEKNEPPGTPSPYLVFADVNNEELLFHPRMSLSGVIDVAEVQNVPSVSSRVFLIKREQIDLLAQILGFSVIPFKGTKGVHETASTVWKLQNNQLIEIPVVIGINNGIYYEIKEGLTGNEELIVNILETSQLKKILEKNL